jgi:ABC-type tungstate transport system substrate-binding protein
LDTLNGLLIPIVLLALLGITIMLCVADARYRGKSPLLVTVAVVFFFPFGLIAWLLFRPEPVGSSRGPRPFKLEDHRLQ